ncbi:hypothetical protein [Nocardia sp. NPDC050406]|uniref:hypothetical protein n=1 Tax=Nocardia sp. NPDC050406 TaxID=3364318 RepID=UPI0037A501DF
MRTFVHLLLFVAAIVIAVGSFGPFVGTVGGREIGFDDIRSGFASGRTLEDIGGRSVSFLNSLTLALLCVAAVILLAALFGSRLLGWLGVIAGFAALGVAAWRLNERFDDRFRGEYRDLLTGAWGLYLVGGGLVLALLCLLVPRERALSSPALPR